MEETAADIVSRPNIKVAKPRRIVPLSFVLLFFPRSSITTPIRARIGVKEEGLSICKKKFPPLIPERLRIHAGIVVPTLAPMIRLMDCLRVMIPEFTKPTTMTVAADEL